jgi:hypothetical protein
MKDYHKLSTLLMPGDSASMDDKWRTAWNLLDEDGKTPIQYRCHARCWLTYRAIEGHVARDEFERRVQTKFTIPADHKDAPRWITSLAVAEFYLWTLWDDERAKLAEETLALHWRKWPPAVLSMLRVAAIRSYDEHMEGNHTTSRLIIEKAIKDWKETMALIDWEEYPLRFLDGQRDMMAMHAMMCTLSRGESLFPWLLEHESAFLKIKEPWVDCLKLVSVKHGKNKGNANRNYSSLPIVNVRLVNDCSGYHIGSALVKSEMMRHMAASGMIICEPAKIIIVNGEGTLHHKSSGSLAIREEIKASPTGSTVAVINSVWQHMPWAIQGVALSAARESLSADEMMRDRMGNEVWTVPDITLGHQYRPPHRGGSGTLIIDSVNTEVSKWLQKLALEMGGKYLRMCEWQGTAKEFIDMLSMHDRVISGRFHGVTMCMLAGTPFLAAPSNTWKTQGMLMDFGMKSCYCDSEQCMRQAIASNGFNTLDRGKLSQVEIQWHDIFARIRSVHLASSPP